jgi:hypothetical protein
MAGEEPSALSPAEVLACLLQTGHTPQTLLWDYERLLDT